MIEYDAENTVPIKFDLCAALAFVFLELNKRMPRKRLEDMLVDLKPEDDVQKLFDVFIHFFEEVFGTVRHKDGRLIKSQFSQVKIGMINDSNTHDQLMHKLQKLVEKLG